MRGRHLIFSRGVMEVLWMGLGLSLEGWNLALKPSVLTDVLTFSPATVLPFLVELEPISG